MPVNLYPLISALFYTARSSAACRTDATESARCCSAATTATAEQKKDAPPHNWGEAMTWEEDLPHNDRMIIDGVTCVHYYEELTDAACGIAD